MRKVFTIRDSKVEAYLDPGLALNRGEMIRMLTDIINDNPQHPFARHPEDYTLFEIGEWDEQLGLYKMHEAKDHVIGLWELKREEKQTPRSNGMVPDLVEPIRELRN